MKILLVEDDSMLGSTLRSGLISSGYDVEWLRDGEVADAALQSQEFDLILLDLSLPGCDGLTLLRRLRERGQSMPIMILTARSDIGDRVTGLDLGADGYLPKPFAFKELEARIRALTRRIIAKSDLVLSCGPVQLNPETKEVRFHNAPVILSSREYRLLHALFLRPGAILSKSQLTEQIYDWNEDLDSNAIEVHIHRLRQKLSPEYIRTVRGIGYQLVSE